MNVTAYEYYKLLVKSARDGTFPSYSEVHASAAYRGDAPNSKCAWGLLIPDSMYTPAMEEWSLGLPMIDRLAPYGMSVMDVNSIMGLHDIRGLKWDAKGFIEEIDTLKCFQGFAERLKREKNELHEDCGDDCTTTQCAKTRNVEVCDA